MQNPLVDPLEPSFNGGLLNPLLSWADQALPAHLTADTPAEVLHSVVTVTMGNSTAESLSSVFAAWFNSRMRSHVPYFVLSGILVLSWLIIWCGLLGATLYKERRRNARLRRSTTANSDEVDARAATSDGLAPQSRYRLFCSMVVRKYLNYRNRPGRVKGSRDNSGKGNCTDDVSSNSGLNADTPDFPASPVIRAPYLSTKTLSGKDRRLLTHASVAAAVGLVSAVFLVAYITQAGSFVALTSTAHSSHSVRTIVVATVGHLDIFLTRSLFESNKTIVSIFERAYPSVERLFTDFGQELLSLLMTDYKIDRLINQLETFLTTVNASMVAMRDIASARESVIKPLQQFSAQLQVHRDGLQEPLIKMCRQHQSLFPEGSCLTVAARLADLRLSINDTKLETDSSVTIVTLINKMLRLDIDNVQRQVQKAKDSLSTGLQAISGVVRQLLGGLLSAVSSQFAQAESAIAHVKSGFDLVANDPKLWGAVDSAGQAILALVVVSCLVFVFICLVGAVLLWALQRYLRIACRIDRSSSDAAPIHPVTAAAAEPSHSDLSASSSPMRSSSSTSGFSSGGGRSRSSPQWSPQSPQAAPPDPLSPLPPRLASFSERWLDLDMDCETTPPIGIEIPREQNPVVWQIGSTDVKTMSQNQKLDRLVTKEWNSFIYCCSFDCSLALLCGALLSLLPLLFGLAFFYASAEVQADACRYLSTEAGNQRWDGMLDEFATRRVWPLIDEALSQRPDLPIRIPNYPRQIIRAIRNDCADANRTIFGIFKLTGLLNATALLTANATRARFADGANLIKVQINATDAKTLIPPELEGLTSVLPQVASVLDSEDYSASIQELGRPLLSLPNAIDFAAEVDRLASTVLIAAPTDLNAAIVRHTAWQLNASLLRSAGLQERLAQLRNHYRLLQASRNFSSMTTALLAALSDVRLTLTDKTKMLEIVDVRFGPTLESHLPKFAAYLDPLATDLLASVGYCDDLHRALETIAVSLCSEAMPQVNVAAFLLLLTTAFFAVMFFLSWWLLVRVGRHQNSVALAECEMRATPGAAESAATYNRSIAVKPTPPPERPPRSVRFGESAV